MNRKEAHEKWGHQYKDNCNKMAKYMGIKQHGNLNCTGCYLVKASENGVGKLGKRKATKSGEHVCIDNKRTHPENPGKKHYWMCALDDFTNIDWLQFSKRKSEMIKFVSY